MQALREYTGDHQFIFDPEGFVTDEHGGNRETKQQKIGRETNKYYHCDSGCLLTMTPIFQRLTITNPSGSEPRSERVHRKGHEHSNRYLTFTGLLDTVKMK